jgi:hypothetical protein
MSAAALFAAPDRAIFMEISLFYGLNQSGTQRPSVMMDRTQELRPYMRTCT